jgi:hypothetical protein
MESFLSNVASPALAISQGHVRAHNAAIAVACHHRASTLALGTPGVEHHMCHLGEVSHPFPKGRAGCIAYVCQDLFPHIC